MAVRLSHRFLRRAGDERLVEHVRAGSAVAFEVAFDRHHRGILAFCRHMLGSAEEAEDAVQHTFMAAYRELRRSDRPVELRPWLYAVARNRCLSVLRARREQALDPAQEPATENLAADVQRREDLRDLLRDLAGLPEAQRSALVLASLGDVPHDEIAMVLGCPRDKVKALVFQARTSLAASREARETSCVEMRQQIATLHGGSLRRNTLRRHLRECAGCREFRAQMRAQHSALALVLPVAPTLALREAVLGTVVTGGGAVAGATATAGLATKALVVVAAGGGVAGVDAIHDLREPARAPIAQERTPAAAPSGTDRVESGDRPAAGRHVPDRRVPVGGGEPPRTLPAPAQPRDGRAPEDGARRRDRGARPQAAAPAPDPDGTPGGPPPQAGGEQGSAPAAGNGGPGGAEPGGPPPRADGDGPAHGKGDGPPERDGPPPHADGQGPPAHANPGGGAPPRGAGPPEHANDGRGADPPAHANANEGRGAAPPAQPPEQSAGTPGNATEKASGAPATPVHATEKPPGAPAHAQEERSAPPVHANDRASK